MQSCEDNPNYDPLDPRDAPEPDHDLWIEDANKALDEYENGSGPPLDLEKESCYDVEDILNWEPGPTLDEIGNQIPTLEEESDLEQARRRAPMSDYPDDINFDQMGYSDLPPKTQRRF